MATVLPSSSGISAADYLRRTLHKDKIILVGHSLGSIVGVLMARARPDLLYALVGTGQVADPPRNYAVAYRELLKKAKALGETRAIDELEEIGPPPYQGGRGYAVQRRWSNFFEGADRFLATMFGMALMAPGYTARDVNDWLDGQSLSAEKLVPETAALEPGKLAGELRVPVFVIQGDEDFTTPTSLARQFLRSIQAPRKVFVALRGGGHFAVFIQSAEFLRELRARVRPLAMRSRAP